VPPYPSLQRIEFGTSLRLQATNNS